MKKVIQNSDQSNKTRTVDQFKKFAISSSATKKIKGGEDVIIEEIIIA